MIESVHGYSVGEEIGSGGMSRVYRGRHQTLGYPVAIKILDPKLASDHSFIERFEREAKQTSLLESPHVVRMLDYGSEGNLYFIVMEYVDGKDLARLISECGAAEASSCRIPAELVLLIVEGVCLGLKKAHDHGIIHRDVKPSNILLDRHGFVKLVDFGLSRDFRQVSHELTMTGVVLGTPAYMSPEQAMGRKDLDARCDIFSLGVLTYHLLTGLKPFRGDRPSEIQEKIINQPQPPLTRDRCPQLTPELDALVSRMLEKDRDRRFENIDEVLQAVQRNLEDLDVTGDVLRYRQDHLARLMNDPVASTAALRQRDADEYIRRGRLHQTAGAGRRNDAVQAFTVAAALDPGNQVAAAALAALRRPAAKAARDASGTTKVFQRQSETQDVTVDIPRRALRPRRRVPRWAAVPALALLLLAIWFMARPTDDGDAGPINPVVSTTLPVVETQPKAAPPDNPPKSRPDAVEVEKLHNAPVVDPGPARNPGNPPRPAEPAELPSTTPVPARKATLTWTVNEAVQIFIDDIRVWSGKEPGRIEIEPGPARHLSVRNDAKFARLDLKVPSLSPGATHNLGRLELPSGNLEVIGIEGMTVAIDGRDIAVTQRKVGSMVIGAGSHQLTLGLPKTMTGYDVKNVGIRTGAGAAFQPLDIDRLRPGVFRCRFSIDKDRVHTMTWTFKKAGG